MPAMPTRAQRLVCWVMEFVRVIATCCLVAYSACMSDTSMKKKPRPAVFNQWRELLAYLHGRVMLGEIQFLTGWDHSGEGTDLLRLSHTHAREHADSLQRGVQHRIGFPGETGDDDGDTKQGRVKPLLNLQRQVVNEHASHPTRTQVLGPDDTTELLLM